LNLNGKAYSFTDAYADQPLAIEATGKASLCNIYIR
jgi:hypothetical protein